MSIEVIVSGDDRAALRFEAMGPRIRQGLMDAMMREWFALQAAVVTTKLSGQVLKRRTGLLASSINVGGPDTATAFEQSPVLLVGRVGTRVWYGKVHEEGGTFEVKAHTRTSPLGRSYPVRAHSVSYPERSFLRSTLRDRSTQIRSAISAAVAAAIRKG